jgi:hypothetical protein
MFDIKLKDGRYLQNVDVCDEILGFMEEIGDILNNQNPVNNENYKMYIYHRNDEECENLLADITSDDIEYICKAYKYKEV